ncbi:TetR/AcrR family transcriptional regulator [Aquabacterium sp. A08]|uniref:TetR/AcrR family transcriptional regulator n=1 Tax=Aquabacterium sp. A08 TaxID=2718532 RepID=UPI001FBBEF2A|nr:TetR/AcrR family transcriptional regulator [Aquabacterium sp. A08]
MNARSPLPDAAAAPVKKSFRAQMHEAREEAIVAAVHRLLADKGFDAMTVDEVAAEAGMAKASLYRHFPSKEALAGAAMVRLMARAQAHLEGLSPALSPGARLRAVVDWLLRAQLAGQMPTLPSENSSLRAALLGNADYMDLLMAVSDRLGGWIEAAQAAGEINPALPPIAVLYTLYARACDPVVGFLRGTGQFSDDEIVGLVLRTCFDGVGLRA